MSVAPSAGLGACRLGPASSTDNDLPSFPLSEGACRPSDTTQTGLLQFHDEGDCRPCETTERSVPPFYHEGACRPSASTRGACRPDAYSVQVTEPAARAKIGESLPPRTDKHRYQARRSLPPLAHPRAVGSPPPRLSSSSTHNQHAAIEAPRQSARVLKAACEAHASRRNASPPIVTKPIAIRTQAACSKRFVTKSIHALCICRSHACGLPSLGHARCLSKMP
jgi:hypothetical protein